MEIYCVKEVEQNPVPKSQTKPFYIGTKEAPSEFVQVLIEAASFIESKIITEIRNKDLAGMQTGAKECII